MRYRKAIRGTMRPLAFITAASLSVPLLAAPPAATRPSEESLQAKVQKLESEVEQLKAREAATTQPSGLASAMPLRDEPAPQPTSFLDLEGLTAGYQRDKGFIIRSEDGNFLLHPWAYFQGRFSADYRQNGKNVTQDSTDTGFEIARLKFVLDGNVFSRDLTYQFIWNTVKSGGNLNLNDAWARYRFHDSPFAIQGGQIRNPLDHEQILFATQTLTVDRSIVDDVFAGGEGIVQGVDLSYGYDQTGPLRGELAITHGLRNNDVSFQDFPTTSANWGAAARVEWKVMGDWKSYDHFSALTDKHNLLVIGAGADYTEAGDTDDLTHVVDVQYDLPCGFSLYAAYLGRYTKDNAGLPGTNGGSTAPGAHPDTYDATGRVMLGYVFNNHFEPYLRYEYIQFDRAGLAASMVNSTAHDITLGANYYFYGQRAKLSGNIIYLPRGLPIGDTAVNDILANPRGGNQVVFQLQFQLII